MMPKAAPDVILHIPQTQLQAVQARLTDYLLQGQYAFVQSFSSGLDTTFDIFPPAIPERIRLVLCPATHGTSVGVTQSPTTDAPPPSVHMATLVDRFVRVCTADEAT